MDPNTPIVLAAARYATREDAEHAFKTVWGAKHEGEFDHMSLAVLTKDSDGKLQEERHDSTTKHLAWGGIALGAALAIVAPPVGVGMLASAGAIGGAGAIVGHFHDNISKEKLQEVSDLLASGQSGIVVVAVNHKKSDITPLLAGSEKSVVIETRAGDIDTEFEKAVKDAKAAK
jgi:uncharacterized membrane protein